MNHAFEADGISVISMERCAVSALAGREVTMKSPLVIVLVTFGAIVVLGEIVAVSLHDLLQIEFTRLNSILITSDREHHSAVGRMRPGNAQTLL
jgi:hypothetical protein